MIIKSKNTEININNNTDIETFNNFVETMKINTIKMDKIIEEIHNNIQSTIFLLNLNNTMSYDKIINS